MIIFLNKMFKSCLTQKIQCLPNLRTLETLIVQRCHIRNLCYLRSHNTILDRFPMKTSVFLPSILSESIKIREKYTKSSKNDNESDSEDEDPEFKDEHDSKIVKTRVNSLRADLIIRAGLNIARNKVEVIFYESKIRVNGRKLLKKSTQLQVGDVIDVIKNFSKINPSHLVISRILILSAKDKEDSIGVHLRRFKNMIIENYKGVDTYKSSET